MREGVTAGDVVKKDPSSRVSKKSLDQVSGAGARWRIQYDVREDCEFVA